VVSIDPMEGRARRRNPSPLLEPKSQNRRRFLPRRRSKSETGPQTERSVRQPKHVPVPSRIAVSVSSRAPRRNNNLRLPAARIFNWNLDVERPPRRRHQSQTRRVAPKNVSLVDVPRTRKEESRVDEGPTSTDRLGKNVRVGPARSKRKAAVPHKSSAGDESEQMRGRCAEKVLVRRPDERKIVRSTDSPR